MIAITFSSVVRIEISFPIAHLAPTAARGRLLSCEMPIFGQKNGPVLAFLLDMSGSANGKETPFSKPSIALPPSIAALLPSRGS
jgi:hypothetical protein